MITYEKMSKLLPEVFENQSDSPQKTLHHLPRARSARAEDEEAEWEGKSKNAAWLHYLSLSHFDASVTSTYEIDH